MNDLLEIMKVALHHNDLMTRHRKAKLDTKMILDHCTDAGLRIHARHLGELLLDKYDALQYLQELTAQVDITAISNLTKQ